MYSPQLPTQLIWRQCLECGHIHTADYFTPAGLAILFGKAHKSQVVGGDFDQQRFHWSQVVQQVVALLPDSRKVYAEELAWLDVGCGNGALVFTAAEFGFRTRGLDARPQTIAAIRRLGYEAQQGDFLSIEIESRVDVISMADLLEHLPDPRASLKKAHDLLTPDGLIFISCPNLNCVTWEFLDVQKANPYWVELEHYHNFSRSSLMRLLEEEGFALASYSVSPRYKACMQVIARKTS
jgi:2-polyprenyl-3-methyl-5-hydroxy-6-metoxy-1,4-benzoquinol methylase